MVSEKLPPGFSNLTRISALAVGFVVGSLEMTARALAGEPGPSPMIEIAPIAVDAAARVSAGYCPCLRWVVGIQAAGGKWETREFLISSEALIELEHAREMQGARAVSQLIQIGAFDAIWKGGHVGIGFDGVTLGDDLDKGYTDLLRTGLYAMLTWIKEGPKGATRFDIRSGHEYEKMSIGLNPEATEHHTLPQSMVFEFETGRWSGNVWAGVALDPKNLFKESEIGYDAGISGHFRVLSIKDLDLGIGLEASAERDPFREAHGLAASDVRTKLYMDLGWVKEIKP